MSDIRLTGLTGKVAVVTGAGRMRSIGRPIAVMLAQAGCKVVLTGTGRDPRDYPQDEKDAGWRDIASVADEVRAAGSEALEVVSNVADPDAVASLGHSAAQTPHPWHLAGSISSSTMRALRAGQTACR